MKVRSFVAIDPEPALQRRLGEVRRELAAAEADVRWVREEGLHCTLKFLGSVEADLLERLRQPLAAAVAAMPAFAVRARGVGTFGGARNPRVVWIGLEDGAGALAALAKQVERALAPFGFEAEKRPFRAHLTLGRVRSPRGFGRLAEILRAHEDEVFGSTHVARVTLYRSDLRPAGSVYTPLCEMPLAER